MSSVKQDKNMLNLSDIPSELVRKMLIGSIEEQLGSQNYKIEISLATNVEDNNFNGIIYRVSFKKDGDVTNGHSAPSSLILKVAPDNLVRRGQFQVRPAFVREMFTFEQIFPTFRNFERSKGIDIEQDGFTEYPTCYRALDTEFNECLLLEDLCNRGFSIIKRLTVEIEHVNLVIRGLAKFHAISFALKDQHPEKFNELTSNLSEVFIHKSNEPLRIGLNFYSKSVFDALTAEKDAHLLAKINEFYEKGIVDAAVDCLDVNLSGPASVITYGDVHQNNIMFRYDSNGAPVEACFLDWQAARHSSPVIDIAYFIFCSTTKELRDAHYEAILKEYHETLSAHIRRLGSDPENLFSYEMMLEHLRRCAKYGLILSSVWVPVLTSRNKSRLDIDRYAEKLENGTLIIETTLEDFDIEESAEDAHHRLRDIVDDMVRLGYI